MSKIYSGAIDCSFNFCGCAILCENFKGAVPFIKATRIVENPKLEHKNIRKSIIDLDRCSLLYSGVKNFVDSLMSLNGTKILAYEVPGGSQSSRAASCLGMAKGVVGSILSIANTNQYTPGSWMRLPLMPSEVHKKVTGKIKASKEEIIEYVLNKYKSDIYFNKKIYWVHQIHDGAPVTLVGYTKGQFEHIADAIVMAELGLERIK